MNLKERGRAEDGEEKGLKPRPTASRDRRLIWGLLLAWLLTLCLEAVLSYLGVEKIPYRYLLRLGSLLCALASFYFLFAKFRASQRQLYWIASACVLFLFSRILDADPVREALAASLGIDENLIDRIFERILELVAIGMIIAGLVSNVFGADEVRERITREIGEHRETQSQLRRSLSLLRATLDSTADGILVVDLAGRITSYNQKFLEMWRLPGELIESGDDGRALDFVIDQLENPEAFLNKVKHLYENPEAESEDEFRFRDGRVFERISRPQLMDGKPVGRVWGFRDVTARRRAEGERVKLEAELRQSHKMEAIGVLAGGIAHDFNNILGSIVGFAEVARMDTPDRPEVQARLDQLLAACQRARALTAKIMAFGRVQAPERRRLGMAEVVADAIELLRAGLPQTIEIRRFFPADLPAVRANDNDVRQVVMNLGTNAEYAMRGKKGLLEFELLQAEPPAPAARPGEAGPGPHVCLTVRDSGAGMDADTQAKIFEPYFTTKPAGEGTGLGLSVVHGIMQNHEGAVTVESTPGEGTTFRLFFPAVAGRPDTPPAPASAEATSARPAPGASGLGGHILLVDDEALLTEVVGDILERLGFTVSPFNCPAAALEAFSADPGRFDLVLTDFTMPRLDGLELASRVREIRPELPVLLTTGYGSNALPKNAVELGIRAVIRKPITVEDLKQALGAERLAGGQRAENARAE